MDELAIMYLAIVVGCSIVTYRYIENPVGRTSIESLRIGPPVARRDDSRALPFKMMSGRPAW